MDFSTAQQKLHHAYQTGNLTLYLGSGVSVDNGLPTWNQLVTAMYFYVLNKNPMRNIRPFPNYLLAIAEWHLNQRREPLDITAGKIRHYYQNRETEFFDLLRQTLYTGYLDGHSGQVIAPSGSSLIEENQTLRGMAELCNRSQPGTSGIHQVISYNYDNLLEIALETPHFYPRWNADPLRPEGKIPIHHVHGFVPMDSTQDGSQAHEITFTEDQYHLAANRADSWSNRIQQESLQQSVGLMVGLSLTDRNIRRLLSQSQPENSEIRNFALLPLPDWGHPNISELHQIHNQAVNYYHKFKNSGSKFASQPGEGGHALRRIASRGNPKSGNQSHESQNKRRVKQGGKGERAMLTIIANVEESHLREQETALRGLGVEPLWYQDHRDIPEILNRIFGPHS